ncbi:MAG: sigma-70 family RNA polymerase sigma factor [Dehalococcoidia bacterium]|nr:sigma-70 family RNA polymerase sigma factor [Dehalococcoidia bacterium]
MLAVLQRGDHTGAIHAIVLDRGLQAQEQQQGKDHHLEGLTDESHHVCTLYRRISPYYTPSQLYTKTPLAPCHRGGRERPAPFTNSPEATTRLASILLPFSVPWSTTVWVAEEARAKVEQDLVQRSRLGDLTAFNQLVERYQGPVYNLALRMLSYEAAAEDVTQEVFLSAYRALGQYREGSFKAWLLTITANACRDLLRKRKRRQETSLEEMVETSGDRSVSPSPTPEEYTLRREVQREIQQALNHLSHDHRLAVLLVNLQGLDYGEAARAMGVSLGTLKSRLSRGRAQLREHLLTARGTREP